MLLSTSAVELLLTLLVGVSAVAFYVRRDDRYRLAFAAFVCAGIAAAITPADPISMILMFIAFFGFFIFGTRYPIAEQPDGGGSITNESIGSLRVAIGISLLALGLFIVGRFYSVTLPEPMLGYQAFRVWAMNLTSIVLLVVAGVVWLHRFLFRRPRVDHDSP